MTQNFKTHQFQNLQELIDSCSSFYEKNKEKLTDEAVGERRKQLSMFIEKFHSETGTLTSKVKDKIVALRKGSTVLLMTAHQPNLFPYSGVLRKATLIYVLEKELERRLGVQVVNFFGIADQDLTEDRWVKSSLLPAISRKDGVLTLSINLPKSTILKNVPKLSIDIIKKWKDEIETWFHNATISINSFCKEHGISKWRSKEQLLHNSFEEFWEIVEEAHERATTYSDFNAFIISKIVNAVWGYDTLFSRFSDCQRIFYPEFNFLLSRFSDYSASLKEIIELFSKNARERGVSEKEHESLPFWYHCDCGSKARLSLYIKDDSIIGHGFCTNCKKQYNINMGKRDNPDVSAIASNISARAIPMILVFSKGLGLSCYVGGVGGIEYLKEAKYVANKLDITLPPTVVWRPHDKYLGISQLEALLEYKRITGHLEVDKLKEEIEHMKTRINNIHREIEPLEKEKYKIIDKLKKGDIDIKTFKNDLKKIVDKIAKIKKTSKLSILSHDLKILENIQTVLKLIPSIIDYAINIGLNETSKQWIDFLVYNGSFTSEVYLKLFLDDLAEFDESYLKL